MKKTTALIAILALGAGAALAGSMAAPMMEAVVIKEETTAGSRAGILASILAILLIGLAISNDSGGSSTTEGGA